jgi:outer membrane protein TolC
MAGASAAQADLKTVQLQLAKRARLLFLEHFWLSAALAINEEEAGLLRASQASRDIAYESGRGSQSDALEAKLALSLVSSTRLGLLGAQGAVVAKINALLHRDLGAKLSQAPTQLGAVLSSEVKESAWVARAIRSRPELQRLHHQANGLRYAVMEQRRSAMPDLGFSLSYSTMWASPEHRLMAGASVSIPLHFGLRRAAVAQAKADLATSVADRQAEVDTVGAETSAAFAALVAASEQAALFSLEILPTAMAVQNTVEAEYRSGRASFSALMSASRQLWRLKLDHATAVTESHRQYALLLDAVGVLPNDQNMGGAS